MLSTISHVTTITMNKRIETMKSQNSMTSRRLRLGILGLALSVSPFTLKDIYAVPGEVSTKQQKPAAKAEAVISQEPLDKVAAARKPEGQKMVDSILSTLEAAYGNNTEIKELRSQTRARDEGVPQALAGWRPTVTLNASVGGQKDIYSGSKKENGDNGLTVAQSGLNTTGVSTDVTLQQNVFNGGKTVAATCQAENLVQAARAQLTEKEREVLLAAVQAYFTVVAKTAELEYRRSNETALRKTLEATQTKFKVGEETRTSIAQAEANLASGTAEREATEAQLLAAEATFERVTGARPGKLKKPGEPSSMPRTLKEAIEIAKKNNPSILAAIYQEKADRSAIKVNDADLLPKVDVQGSVGRQGSLQRTKYTTGYLNQSHDLTTSQKVSVNLSMPLYEAGLKRAKTRELRETAEFRRIQIETTRRQVIEKLVEAWETYLSAKANMDSYRTQVKANEVSLEGTRQEMLVGSKILLDVLNAQRELVSSQLNLVRAEQNFYQAAYTVLALMGRLNALDMKLNVKRYDPQVHYQDVRNSF